MKMDNIQSDNEKSKEIEEEKNENQSYYSESSLG